MVQAKQFVHHLWTLCQKTANLLTMWTGGWQSSPACERMGKRREAAKRWHRKGERPIPGRKSLLTATKAACALASHLVKWGVVESDGVNQRPSHLISPLGWKTILSRWTGAAEGGSLSLFVGLWISSVLGTGKPTPRRDPLALSIAYCLCRIRTLRRVESDEAVRAKSST